MAEETEVSEQSFEQFQPIQSQISSRSLSAVLPALSSAIGLPCPTPVHPDAQACQQALGLPSVRSAIVIVVDGLGFHNLQLRIGHAPNLRSLIANQTANQSGDDLSKASILTCYPSTTVAALSAFGTGTCPGLTGMLGYTQLNPKTRKIAQMIQFRGALSPKRLQQQPTVFERLAQQHVRVTTVGLGEFSSSPLTTAALRGTDYRSVDDPEQRVRLAADLSAQPGLTYLYFRAVDKAGHHAGWESDEWAAALEQVDSLIGNVVRLSAPGTLVVVTADHGMVDIDLDQQIDIADHEKLAEGVWKVGGEPRALMLYAHRGADSSEVSQIAQRWKSVLADQAHVFTKQEALDMNLFGPVDPRVKPMIGDVIVMAHHRVTIVNSHAQTEGARHMPGVHGSHTEIERRIPLIMDVAE